MSTLAYPPLYLDWQPQVSSRSSTGREIEHAIRLLTIHPALSRNAPISCTLKVQPLLRTMYRALSYTWGPEYPVSQIYVNDYVLEVRENLFAALLCLRDSNFDRLVWIDAVCIDQSCILERNYTVDFMREVYRNAMGGVVVWLGEAGHDTHLVENFLGRLIEESGEETAYGKKVQRLLKKRDGPPPLNDPGYRALYNLLLTPWSSRVWIVQEVVMADLDSDLQVYRGRFVFGMQRLAFAMSLIYKFEVEKRLGYKYPARFATIWAERIYRKHHPGLLEVVERNWLTYATDPRDKIYALAGLASDVQLRIDYSPEYTVQDVYTDFARSIISKYHNLAILGALSSFSADRLSDLPSWVPDWRVWNAYTRLLISPKADDEGRGGFLHFTAAGNRSTSFTPLFTGVKRDKIQLEGHIIDTIHIDGPMFKRESSINEIISFFDRSESVAGVANAYMTVDSFRSNYGRKINIVANAKYRHTGEPLLQAFYAALTMDDLQHLPQRFDRFNRKRRLCKTYFDFHELLCALRGSQRNFFRPRAYDPILVHALSEHYITSAMNVLVNRSLIITGANRLGIFGGRVQMGDAIVLLKGARVPFVIRKSRASGEEQVWKIVGDGYLHGVMEGEAWREEKSEKFTFS